MANSVKISSAVAVAWLALAVTSVSCSRTAESEAHAETTARDVAVPAPLGTASASVAVPFTKTASVSEAKQSEPRIRFVAVELKGALEDALATALGKEVGVPLSQVAMRTVVWWVDVQRELYRGDKLEIVFEPRLTEEPLVHAMWLTSAKLGKTVAAVRYKAEGEVFARWYREDGSEHELRLVDSPIEGYEQITSLLNDGRRHKGVDFKAPVGTPIKAPFNAFVVKKNWGGRNGNCLWLQDPQTGKEAKLLHLDRIGKGIAAGTKVTRGQTIATSGNTGRSTAPHLHYQLEKNGHVIDPFRVHGTWRAKLKGEDIEKAKAALTQFAALRTGTR